MKNIWPDLFDSVGVVGCGGNPLPRVLVASLPLPAAILMLSLRDKLFPARWAELKYIGPSDRAEMTFRETAHKKTSAGR